MLNLNLTFAHEALDDSATSNSSIVNVESQSHSSNVADEDSVSGDGDGDTVHCFNFDILNDRTSQSEFVTRTLFPMSQQVNSNSLVLFPNSNEPNDIKPVHVQANKPAVQQQQNQVVKKSRRGPRSRSSQYRGVTFYRRTGRWESHIWDCGKQVYLGGFDTAHAAARAYDRAAIKFRGVDADINFSISDYEEDMNQIKNLSKEDFVHLLRRHTSGFSRGGSKYRGVTLNNCGMWDAPMGQFLGKKAPYDKAAMKLNEYDGENVASQCENRHNLDLNLRISTPSCHGNGPTRNDHMEQQAGNASATTLKGLPVLSEHGQSWTTTMYPQIIGNSSQGPSNWTWQPYRQGQSQTPTALFTAASSGFPAPATQNYLNYN